MLVTEKTLVIKMPLITHIAYTQNKLAPDKFMKINGQHIYDGTMHRFKRAIVVENMHYYFVYNIPDEMLNLNIQKVKSIAYIFHTVINHGNIRRIKGVRSWKKAAKDYVPNWDIENLSSIWIKTGNGSLSIAKVISDDNIGVIQKVMYGFNEVEDIDDLELEIIIKY